MGAVYRARDPRLEREVAIKVLPPELARDSERLRRFTLEARAAGALQHPNIAAVFDVGTHEGLAYVVEELVPGGTLQDRLTRGAVPLRDAVRLAAGIAAGLAAAHEKGIVHRDLKPANVAIASDGRPQVLDFGLARVARPSDDATLAVDSASAGMLIGTVGYMAPEQVRGEAVDGRADLFALGTMLHEMLSGSRPFARGSAVETMHAILADETPPLPASVPPALVRVVERCLAKDPGQRFQSARDLAFTLELVSGEPRREATAGETPVAPAPVRTRPAWAFGVAIAVVAALAFLAGRFLPRAAGESSLLVTSLSYGGQDNEPSASPDGRLVAYSSVRDNGAGIRVMEVATRNELRLTDGPDFQPRFSPDGTTLLFTRNIASGRSLWKVPVLGGTPRRIVDDATDGDWAPDGSRIAYLTGGGDSSSSGVRLMVGNPDGSGVRQVAKSEAVVWFSPRWSPDGRSIVVTESGNQNSPGTLQLVDVATGRQRELRTPRRASLTNACWDGSGTGLLVVEGDGVVAVQSGRPGRLYRIDVRTGRARPLGWLSEFPALIDLMPDGRLVMSGTLVRQNLREVEFGPRGIGEGRWLTRGACIDRQPVYSPDGASVMFSSNRGGALDLWELSLATGDLHRITDDPADDWDPAYSPDGKSIAWSSNRGGAFEIWIASRDGRSPRQLSRDSLDAENPTFTADGATVYYSSSNPTKVGVWRVPAAGGEPEHVLVTSSLLPEVSPVGHFASVILASQTPAPRLEVLDLTSGRPLPNPQPLDASNNQIVQGRSRWTPDGRSVLFTAQSPEGSALLLRRSLEAWRGGAARIDTLAEGSPEVESFGVAPDARHLTISVQAQRLSGLSLIEGLTGITPPGRGSSRGAR